LTTRRVPALVLLAAAGVAAVPPVPSAADRDAFVAQVMREGGIPGMQVAVVKDGKIAWSKAFGQAVLADPGPARPMREDDLLYTCSIGKMITAVAVLRQVENGKISLDDDISTSLPFPIRNPKWPDVPITWRMLLTHTSSLQDDDAIYDALYFYGVDNAVSPTALVEETFRDGGRFHGGHWFLDGRPGTERVYCNQAMNVAAYALQRYVGGPFLDYATREILRPLGMRDSGYVSGQLPVTRRAVGYGRTLNSSGQWIFLPDRVSFSHLPPSRSLLENLYAAPSLGDGGLYTSAREFSRFVASMINGGTLDGVTILRPESVRLLLTPSGFWSPYGYQQGLVFMAARGLEESLVWGHDGIDRGFVASAQFDRETGVGAVSLANANTPGETLSRRLVDLNLHLLSWFR
jgi:CubicO group peptidase (beta-lactamase class C family)